MTQMDSRGGLRLVRGGSADGGSATGSARDEGTALFDPKRVLIDHKAIEGKIGILFDKDGQFAFDDRLRAALELAPMLGRDRHVARVIKEIAGDGLRGMVARQFSRGFPPFVPVSGLGEAASSGIKALIPPKEGDKRVLRQLLAVSLWFHNGGGEGEKVQGLTKAESAIAAHCVGGAEGDEYKHIRNFIGEAEAQSARQSALNA